MDPSQSMDRLDRYFDGGLSDRSRAELEADLLASEDLRREFWRRAQTHALLRRFAEESPVALRQAHRSSSSVGSLVRSSRRMIRAQILMAMLCALLAVVIWQRLPGDGVAVRPAAEGTPAPTDPMSDAVAVLVHANDVEWGDPTTALSAGASISPGRLNLISGVAVLEFGCGASVVLEAPIDFEVVSAMEGYCHAGRLSATVPPAAAGFLIRTPDADVVDRGTSFGLIVQPAGATEVHVLEGSVELNTGHLRDPLLLMNGAAVKVRGEHPVEPLAATAPFISVADAGQRAEDLSRQRRELWRANPAVNAADSSLVAWYTFEPESARDRRLRNQALNAASDSHGTLVGCEWTEGRWPGKGALVFARPTDRVRLQLGGEFESLTMLAWIRVHSLSNDYNSLLLSDGFDAGEFHWNLSRSGALHFGISDAGPDRKLGHFHSSRPVISPDRYGQWIHVGVVYDGTEKQLVHWMDGQAVSAARMAPTVPTIFSTAEIGNWQPRPGAIYPVRNFNGRMDELVIYRRALAASEIRRHFETGRPESVSNSTSQHAAR